MSRYQVGCAGQFVTGQVRSTNDLVEAMAMCDEPPGCEVYDSVERKWLGAPQSMEELAEAKARLEARDAA